MKPRNKFEKAVLAQSKKLRPITPIQINWAFRNCVEHYAHRLPKGRTTCMDCGHSWVMTEQTEHCTCPECGASLKVCLTYQRKVRQKQYFTTLTTSGEYQVLRMFLLVVGMEKGVNAKSYALEIGQYWWNEQGRKAVVAIPRTLGCYWKIQCKLPPKTKRFCPLKTFNNAPLKSLDRWGYYYFSLFPSVCSHFTDTFSCQLNPVRRMYNTIHNGICYCRVSDCIIPIVRWQLRGDDDGLAPMSVLYYIEQDGSFLGIKVHKEEVIQYEQRAPFDSLEFRFQCAFYFCHLKRTHKFRSIRIICPYALLAGFIPHCCGKEALPGTG